MSTLAESVALPKWPQMIVTGRAAPAVRTVDERRARPRVVDVPRAHKAELGLEQVVDLGHLPPLRVGVEALVNIYAVSDLHFGHQNIIKHANRPFASVEEMDETLVDNWNSTVHSDDDIVYVVGDFSFNGKKNDLLPLFNRLRGTKHLIRGNHDHTIVRKLPWESVEVDFRGEIHGRWVHMYHYPIVAWDRQFHGSVHVFGHTHDKFPWALNQIKNCWSACVELNGYRPVEFKSVFAQVDFRNSMITNPRDGRDW